LFRAGPSSAPVRKGATRRLSPGRRNSRPTVLDRPEGKAPACPLAPADSCLLLGGPRESAPPEGAPGAAALGDQRLEDKLVVV
jgi:hypothetical protein